MSEPIILYSVEQGHEVMRKAWTLAKPRLIAGHKLALTIKDATRTLEQNAAQWPILDAFSKQLKWPVNGQMVTMDPEEWKDVLTAAFNGEYVRRAMGLNGGVVMLGLRTSKMSIDKFSAWLDFLHATAAQRGIALDDRYGNNVAHGA